MDRPAVAGADTDGAAARGAADRPGASVGFATPAPGPTRGGRGSVALGEPHAWPARVIEGVAACIGVECVR